MVTDDVPTMLTFALGMSRTVYGGVEESMSEPGQSVSTLVDATAIWMLGCVDEGLGGRHVTRDWEAAPKLDR